MTKQLDPYASHLPTLHAMVGMLQPKTILEFGSGFYSTPFFLALPGLERLVSVERDAAWRKRVKQECQDHRLELVTASPKPAEFDLIFIDDGQSPEERVVTIAWVLGQEHPPVVIHDVEVSEYAAAIDEASEEPATGVIW